jgi:hypothetical protein
VNSIWTVLSYLGLAAFVSCAAAYHVNEYLVGRDWGCRKPPVKPSEKAEPNSIAATTSR